jgi:uncharacterized repeat protein (TIGR03803 family)
MNLEENMPQSLFCLHSHQPQHGPAWSPDLPRHLLLICFLLIAATADSQTDFLRLKSFGNPETSAATPRCVPIEASDGVLYGTTVEGGTNDFGTVFKVNKDGSGFVILHVFAGGTNDGRIPQGGVTEGDDGALYGTTFSGGQFDGGVVYRLTKDGASYSILKHVSAGSAMKGSLLKGSDGSFYGTTAATVYKLNPDGSGFIELHTFGGVGDGQFPQFGVVEGSDGALYGTTSHGGLNDLGTVYRLNKDGSGYALLHSFTHPDARTPQAGLYEASNGLLYGTTSYRTPNSYGTVFQLEKSGSNFTVLHTFTGTNSEGWYPQAALAEGNDGALYGTTTHGGLEGQGTVFKLNLDGSSYGVVHHFSWDNGDGRIPQAGLFKGTNGTFFGTTSVGGSADYGSVFNFDPATSNNAVVTSFSWTGGDGWNPQANLLEASDDWLYGTTFNGGSNDFGTVFRMNKDRNGYTVLHHFNWLTDGAFPQGGVIEATNGALYGTAFEGGSNGFGTVFTLNKDGSAFVVLHHFSGIRTNGSHPQAALLQASDGVLYGTTAQGGTNNWGTVFKLNLNGTGFAMLRNNGSAEIEPGSSLIEGSDGRLYGATAGVGGGTNGSGSVFRLNKNGSAFTTLRAFTGSTNEGRGLVASLLEGTNGALFGTAFRGGSAGYGVVFTMNKDGTDFAVLRSFGPTADARNPMAGLIEGSDGLLYGTTLNGAATGDPSSTNRGALFKIGPDGSNYQVLHNFSPVTAGKNPRAALVVSGDGALYGTASAGGDMGAGVIFSVANPAVFTELRFNAVGALLQFQGVSNRIYAIQATTNLEPASWQVLPGYATNQNESFQFLDLDATNAPVKFYRIFSH